MLTNSQLYKGTICSPRRPLVAVVTCCAVFIAGGHWRETATSSRTTPGPDISVRLARPQSLRTTTSSDDHPHGSLNAKLGSGAVHQQRKLLKEVKWRTKQDHMCPPGINLCIQHKQARDGVAADVAAQQKDLRADEVAATREQQQQERLAAEESALARQARGGDSDQALMAAAQTSTFQNFMLRQHTPESRRDILKRRAAAKRQHRAKALEYLRERLVEESQWEKAQAEAAEVTRREDALRAAIASGEAAAKVVHQQKSPREMERNAMSEWLQKSGFGKNKGHFSSKRTQPLRRQRQ